MIAFGRVCLSITDSRRVHPAKDPFSILTMEDGMVICRMTVFPANTEGENVVTGIPLYSCGSVRLSLVFPSAVNPVILPVPSLSSKTKQSVSCTLPVPDSNAFGAGASGMGIETSPGMPRASFSCRAMHAVLTWAPAALRWKLVSKNQLLSRTLSSAFPRTGKISCASSHSEYADRRCISSSATAFRFMGQKR